CWPTFASPACFAALLGTADNGYWSLRPSDKITAVHRCYRPGTMILETTFTTAAGEVCLTDFMPPRGKHSDVIRLIRCTRGKVALRMELALRFDYGLTVPWVTKAGSELRAVAGPNMVVLRSECTGTKPAKLHGEGLTTIGEFTLREGQQQCFVLTYATSTEEVPKPIPIEAAFNDTETFWRQWIARSKYDGDYKDAVERSLMTLKALTYLPTGGIVASVTTSLPEKIGGERNWDYRYCWLRDTSFTLLVLLRAGYTDEAIGWRRWLLRAIAGNPDQLQTLYGLAGERELVEWEATWLPGYESSRPVRIGNAASGQFQLDVYGEVSAALARTPAAGEDIRVPATQLHAHLIDHLCDIWHLPDDGIWEVRGALRHFVYSKAMAWLALDRAIKHHEHFDGPGDVKRWRRNCDKLHAEICSKGFNKRLNSFTQSYGSKNVDASCLRLALVGFLPPGDPRIIGTIDAI